MPVGTFLVLSCLLMLYTSLPPPLLQTVTPLLQQTLASSLPPSPHLLPLLVDIGKQ